MKSVNKKDLPVEILDNELPYDDNKQYKAFYDERKRNSSGFTDVIFLVAIMVVCFMWGMLAVILR